MLFAKRDCECTTAADFCVVVLMETVDGVGRVQQLKNKMGSLVELDGEPR
jgi:hypothetical protein